MSDEIPVCPDCDSTQIQKNVQTDKYSKKGAVENSWLCRMYQNKFNEPDFREPKNEPSFSGSVKKLLDADPDEYP